MVHSATKGLFARSSTGDMNVTVNQFSVEVPAEPAAYGPRISTDVSAMNGTGSSVIRSGSISVQGGGAGALVYRAIGG